MAQIILTREGIVAHRESKTFERRATAEAWIKKREGELARPEAVLGRRPASRAPTLAQAIERYIAESRRAMGRTKAQVLAAIAREEISELRCDQVDSAAIIAFAHRMREGRSGATVLNYLSHLSAVFSIGRAAWSYPLDPQAMADASRVSARLGLSGKAKARDRRPTLPEIETLLLHFRDVRKRRPSTAPMVEIILFAIFSTRRQEEITRLQWADLDGDGSRVLVRDMKNPGDKAGNHVWCELPEPAQAVIARMPRQGARIFPYSTDAISAAFTRACKVLGIEDLHFHDLRHEGVSRLFEMGLTIPQVASVSGHRSWHSLKRYTHLRQSGDKFEGWGWLDRLA